MMFIRFVDILECHIVDVMTVPQMYGLGSVIVATIFSKTGR